MTVGCRAPAPKLPIVEGAVRKLPCCTPAAERNRATLSGVPDFGHATACLHEKEHHHGQADCDGRDRRHPPPI
jgi:hypothetical protein